MRSLVKASKNPGAKLWSWNLSNNSVGIEVNICLRFLNPCVWDKGLLNVGFWEELFIILGKIAIFFFFFVCQGLEWVSLDITAWWASVIHRWMLCQIKNILNAKAKKKKKKIKNYGWRMAHFVFTCFVFLLFTLFFPVYAQYYHLILSNRNKKWAEKSVCNCAAWICFLRSRACSWYPELSAVG